MYGCASSKLLDLRKENLYFIFTYKIILKRQKMPQGIFLSINNYLTSYFVKFGFRSPVYGSCSTKIFISFPFASFPILVYVNFSLFSSSVQGPHHIYYFLTKREPLFYYHVQHQRNHSLHEFLLYSH